jgi:hypothetical protein
MRDRPNLQEFYDRARPEILAAELIRRRIRLCLTGRLQCIDDEERGVREAIRILAMELGCESDAIMEHLIDEVYYRVTARRLTRHGRAGHPAPTG